MYSPIRSQSATGTTMNDDVNWSVINSLSDSALNSALSLNEFFEFDFISALLGNYYEFFYAVNYVLQE